MSQNVGKVVQVIGSTLDAEFPEGNLPEIYNALELEIEVMGNKLKLVCEVQQHLGGNRVRAVVESTGYQRGAKIVNRSDIGFFGEETLGRFSILAKRRKRSG